MFDNVSNPVDVAIENLKAYKIPKRQAAEIFSPLARRLRELVDAGWMVGDIVREVRAQGGEIPSSVWVDVLNVGPAKSHKRSKAKGRKGCRLVKPPYGQGNFFRLVDASISKC